MVAPNRRDRLLAFVLAVLACGARGGDATSAGRRGMRFSGDTLRRGR